MKGTDYSEVTMNYEITDFQKDVIERSLDTSVLVDFWAAWCGPCKVLGPILGRLEQKSNGQWVLAKVDTDRHQDLAAKYGIRGIPNVKLFVDGKVSNEFTGALPEPSVVQWLHKALPSRFRKEIESAQELLKQHKTNEGQSILENILQNDPGNEHAKVLLAGSLVSTEAQKAMSLVANIEEHSEHYPAADAILMFGKLTSTALHPELLPNDAASQSTSLRSRREVFTWNPFSENSTKLLALRREWSPA